MLTRKAASEKVMILGIDGMDPRLTKKFISQGDMPNTKKLFEQGACREDMVLLGGNPTVTPPMWTTLSTGAYPMTHGITGFFRHSDKELDVIQYNLDSRNCKAEQLWNVFAESGKKTLVWHWPGCAWPPTSDSENLYVVDGTSPGNVNMGTAQVENEFILGASVDVKETRYLNKVKGDIQAPCIITGLEKDEEAFDLESVMKSPDIRMLIMYPGEGETGSPDGLPVDIVQTQIKDAYNWTEKIEGAKEFNLLLSSGLIRRPCQIWMNEEGIFDRVAIFKSKKEKEPLVVLSCGKIYSEIRDVAIKNDVQVEVIRNMRLLNLAADGTNLKMWVSAANKIDADDVFHPKRIYKDIVNNVGYPLPTTQIGEHNYDLIKECTIDNWYLTADWQAKSIHHLIEKEGIEVIFSHFHNVDLIMHKLVRNMSGTGKAEAEFYQQMVREVYIQTDYYIGKYLDLLDDGWTIMLVSDHAQVCPQHKPTWLGDLLGVNVRIMEELGFTVLKKDEDGKELREIDWDKTKAIAIRENDIYINLKGRWDTGIVDPKDQYELEEEIMTALYGYKDKKTGKRVVSMAIRNRDAAVLGLGGPESGDIIYFTAEGYNYDHADGLSTTYGMHDTSLSPIFIAAGPGFKNGKKTNMTLRQVDVAPTMAVIGGVRMPRECEGAPMYSILQEEY
ncbi:MAG: alkaline phosphatase family protein [Clostridiales bacterium]|nr:alkaline phosphatase family protein [Peptococcus niger]MDU5952557.1 alkaline phosphatase family protein [Clostridiales bacterium]MDU7244566.1 alkaline phosphatase family protein [Clostridiales bacterium]MDU7505269.1 alkaline phosphatase family protein [Clostridia bacterium]